jgi:hypothetical protein
MKLHLSYYINLSAEKATTTTTTSTTTIIIIIKPLG